MPIEYVHPTRGSESAMGARLCGRGTKPSGWDGTGEWLCAGDTVQSLPISHDAGCAQYRLVECVGSVFLRVGAPSLARNYSRGQFAVFVDESCVEEAVAGRVERADPRRVWLLNKLLAAFEAEPVEDGVHHPAEQVIQNALGGEHSEFALDCLKEIAVDNARPGVAASVLRCLGRCSGVGSPSWRANLVRTALAQDDVELRDAAVQAAELWADREVTEMLKTHRDPVPWLQHYLRDVVDDLNE